MAAAIARSAGRSLLCGLHTTPTRIVRNGGRNLQPYALAFWRRAFEARICSGERALPPIANVKQHAIFAERSQGFRRCGKGDQDRRHCRRQKANTREEAQTRCKVIGDRFFLYNRSKIMLRR